MTATRCWAAARLKARSRGIAVTGRHRSAPPNLDEEDRLRLGGHELIAGIDEAGRGALAGPVVAAAVILAPHSHPDWLDLVRDSKELSPRKREFLFPLINGEALAVGTGVVPPEVIDRVNILEATRLAMMEAVEKLPRQPGFLLIDSLTLPHCKLPQRGITRGDQHCLSIACASIVAKVTRDHIMQDLDRVYPGYGWARNKGYGTREHLLRLQQHRPSPIHRLSFAPVRKVTASPLLHSLEERNLPSSTGRGASLPSPCH
ncbi:MAG: ribonuclease HII, partial [Dehalococcoidia bacterium]|nr:ribonuclease HII [Dehalococcoidia bacterium]